MVKSWTCKACPGYADREGCHYANYDNPDFVPKVCPGDGGLAQWRQDVP